MGVGTPLDLVEAVHRGVDLFRLHSADKNGAAGLRLHVPRRARNHAPSDATRTRPTRTRLHLPRLSEPTLGYIHHLLRVGNAQGVRWVAIHNIHHTQTLMSRLRSAILGGSWESLYVELSEHLAKRLKTPLVD